MAPPGSMPGAPPMGEPSPIPPSSRAPEPARPADGAVATGPRKVRLTVARVDPWSVLKLSFLLSVAFAIATVVASIVIWEVLNAMGVWDSLNTQLRDLSGKSNSSFNLNDYVGLGRVVSITTLVAVVNVVVSMALATLGAVLYNIAASLVGGVNLTLSDD
jgi:transmembrane protein DUF3566